MPTNYSGNPTATQAPGPQPKPGAVPIGALPIDGEAANAASIAQAHKESLDMIAWLMKPLARSTQWAEPTWQTQTPNGINRFTIDHSGYPAWGIESIRESWILGPSVGGSTSSGFFQSLILPWHWFVVGSGGMSTVAPGTSAGLSPFYRQMVVTVSGTSGDQAYMGASNATCMFVAGSTISMEFSANLGDVLANNVTWGAGLCSAVVTFASVASPGIFFRKASTDANWQCVTSNGSLETVVDSGLAPSPNVSNHFKVVWSGATGDDSATSRALFFIDGLLVGNITSNLPTNQPAIPLFAGNKTATASSNLMRVSPTWVTYNQL